MIAHMSKHRNNLGCQECAILKVPSELHCVTSGFPSADCTTKTQTESQPVIHRWSSQTHLWSQEHDNNLPRTCLTVWCKTKPKDTPRFSIDGYLSSGTAENHWPYVQVDILLSAQLLFLSTQKKPQVKWLVISEKHSIHSSLIKESSHTELQLELFEFLQFSNPRFQVQGGISVISRGNLTAELKYNDRHGAFYLSPLWQQAPTAVAQTSSVQAYHTDWYTALRHDFKTLMLAEYGCRLTFIDFSHVHAGVVQLQGGLKCWEKLAKQGGVL